MSMDINSHKRTSAHAMVWCVGQQAITLPNIDPDLCRHSMSLGHKKMSYQVHVFMQKEYIMHHIG